MSRPTPIQRRLQILLCAYAFIAAIWLLVPVVSDYFGVDSTTAQAQITAVDPYQYLQHKAPRSSSPLATREGKHYLVQFDYGGQTVKHWIDTHRQEYQVGTEVEVTFAEAPPHRIIRLNGEWQPPQRLFPIGVLLLLSLMLWITRNGIKMSHLKNLD